MPVEVVLPTGVLRYAGHPDNVRELATLCGFGARRNPKRGFVFVSRVLGKHWPSAPSVMAGIQRELAMRIPRSADDVVLFVSMAETATGLGHGVFQAFLETATVPALLLQTTRYPLSGADVLEFEEEHSHATQQYLHLPECTRKRALFSRATRVVLVDDETTSGRTFVNLVRVLAKACPCLRAVHPLVLTDFSEGRVVERLMDVPGVDAVAMIAAWHGRHEFVPDPAAQAAPAPRAHAPVGCRRRHVSGFTARLGLDHATALPTALLAACESLLDQRPVLVVGTGECMYPAQLLAQSLEAGGRTVMVQSTTRSPLLCAGAIEDATVVTDVYGEGISNYLYNLSRSAGWQVIVVHESRERDCVQQLVAQLGAIECDLAELQMHAAVAAAEPA